MHRTPVSSEHHKREGGRDLANWGNQGESTEPSPASQRQPPGRELRAGMPACYSRPVVRQLLDLPTRTPHALRHRFPAARNSPLTRIFPTLICSQGQSGPTQAALGKAKLVVLCISGTKGRHCGRACRIIQALRWEALSYRISLPMLRQNADASSAPGQLQFSYSARVIPIRCMRDCSVVRFIPSRAAAP